MDMTRERISFTINQRDMFSSPILASVLLFWFFGDLRCGVPLFIVIIKHINR